MKFFRDDFTAQGYPVYNEIIEILQNEFLKINKASYRNVANTKVNGNTGIIVKSPRVLSATTTDTTVSFDVDSMIFLNDEFLEPFDTLKNTTVVIASNIFYLIQNSDENTTRQFADGLTQNLITKKTFTYTTTLPTGVPYITFTNGVSTRDLEKIKFLKNSPIGTILTLAIDSLRTTKFSETTSLGLEEYLGWAICNGANGTLDLQGRTLVGLDLVGSNINDPAAGVKNYTNVGNKGGKLTNVLTKTNLPNIQLNVSSNTNPAKTNNFPIRGYNPVDSSPFFAYCTLPLNSSDVTSIAIPSIPVNGITETLGSSTEIENRQPYITVLYIQKIA